MNKLVQFKRLSLGLSIKILAIYVKRLFGKKLNESDTVYLSYLYTLEICNLKHLSEDTNCFETLTDDGVKLILRKYPSSDNQVLHQIWVDEEYKVIVDLIKNRFKRRELFVVDAGANVGYSSVYLYFHLKEYFDIRIIVVEPGSENLKILKRNFKVNGLENYFIEEAGLYNKSCYLNIVKDFRDGRDWSLRVEESDVKTDLRSVELHSIMEKYGWNKVDFCKVDIEGSEQYIFQDEIYADRFLKDIELISIEIHDEMNIRQKIRDSLNKNRFEYFDHGELTIASLSSN